MIGYYHHNFISDKSFLEAYSKIGDLPRKLDSQTRLEAKQHPKYAKKTLEVVLEIRKGTDCTRYFFKRIEGFGKVAVADRAT